MVDYLVLHGVCVLAICIKPVVCNGEENLDLLLYEAISQIFIEKMDYKPTCYLFRTESRASRYSNVLAINIVSRTKSVV